MVEKETVSLMSKFKLSPREFDCLVLTFYGFSAKRTGKQLNISDRTVSANLRGVFSKLNISRKDEIHDVLNKNKLTNFLEEFTSHYIKLNHPR